MKNLVQRTISGIIYLIIIIGSLFLGKYFFGAAFLLITILALLEFYEMNGISRTDLSTVLGLAAASAIFVLSFLIASQQAGIRFLSMAVLLPVLMFVVTLYATATESVRNLAISLTGLFFVVIPLAVMNYLVFPAVNDRVYTYRILMGILSLVWINDIGAYVTGTLFGRHKLFPRISPHKSWEGLFGGAILTMAAALWMGDLLGILYQTHWIMLGVVVSVFGIGGDLTESWFKRKTDRKDSGTLIPGHGGVLDRIDSILFVMPASFIYLVMNGL